MAKAAYGLIVISAPSGTGKSTLCKRLLSELKDSIHLSISTTSRKPRGEEKHGVEYFFVSEDEFKNKIARGDFLEWAQVHGNYYGTEKAMLEGFWSKQRHVLLDIDVQGANSLRDVHPDKTFTVFLVPPSMEELERRLRGRGTENEEAIQKRMKNARDELGRQHEFDQVIVNDNLERTYSELKQVVTKFTKNLEKA